MFTQDHGRDLDALLGMTDPIALVRFGDGEIALIDGNVHKSADAWRTTGPSWIRGDLVTSLRHAADGWCIGLPTPCCLRSGIRIHPAVRVPAPQRTFATLFLHSNLHRIHDVLERFSSAIIVGSWFGDVRIPEDGVSKSWDIDACVDEIIRADRDVLLAAGPCANVIAMKYWERVPAEARHFVLDVGSALDVHHGKLTRHFHDTMLDHRCVWSTVRDAPGRPAGRVERQRTVVRPYTPPEPVDPITAAPAKPKIQERGRVRAEPLGKTTKIGKRP
jgi:hypothetical protein